jgi:hypothetical protein
VGPPFLYKELNPRDWPTELCEELAEILRELLAQEPNSVIRLGYENIKAPGTVAILAAPPSADAVAWLGPICAARSGLNLHDDGIGCANHYCSIEWTSEPQPRRGWLARLWPRLVS